MDYVEYKLGPWFDWINENVYVSRLQPPARCGTLTHDNHLLAPERAVRALDWTGDLTFTPGGTAIIRGDSPENRDSLVKSDDQND